jgi:hypothetical protein
MNQPGPQITNGTLSPSRSRREILYLTSKDNAQPRTDLAYLCQCSPGIVAPDFAKSTRAFDLERLRDGEHLVMTRVDNRG